MQHTALLPNPRSVLVPVLALTLGAAGATATYALLDSSEIDVGPTRVIVTETSPPSQGVAAKDEATTAAAITAPAIATGTAVKDEAAAASAIGQASGETSTGVHKGGGPPAESSSPNSNPAGDAATANRTDPRGPAAQIHSMADSP